MSAKSENRAMKRQRASKRASIYEPLEGRVLMCYEPHDVAPLPQNPSLENAPPAQTQSAAARTGGGGETYALDGGTPFNIVWTNRGLASDNFAATFGGNANLARGVVDSMGWADRTEPFPACMWARRSWPRGSTCDITTCCAA